MPPWSLHHLANATDVSHISLSRLAVPGIWLERSLATPRYSLSVPFPASALAIDGVVSVGALPHGDEAVPNFWARPPWVVALEADVVVGLFEATAVEPPLPVHDDDTSAIIRIAMNRLRFI